jgi:hypothetical protein
MTSSHTPITYHYIERMHTGSASSVRAHIVLKWVSCHVMSFDASICIASRTSSANSTMIPCITGRDNQLAFIRESIDLIQVTFCLIVIICIHRLMLLLHVW